MMDLPGENFLMHLLIFIYLIYALYIGAKGRRIAWQRRKFRSVAHFQATMNVWNIVGGVFTILGILHFIWSFNAFVWPYFDKLFF